MKPSLSALLLGSLLAAPLAAEEVTVPEQFDEAPPPPPMVIKGDAGDAEEDEFEPEVTIINREDATYEEYRLNGRLYMVKVVPKVGPPYYFVDRDGDGLLETREHTRAGKVQVPQWVIFSW